MQPLSFSSTIRLWNNGKQAASWHFVNVSKEASAEIRALTEENPHKGFGSVRVEVRIGFVVWETSVFPDKKSGCYILPLKKKIREELQISEGDEVLVELTIV